MKDKAMKLALEALELSAVTVDNFRVQKATQYAITTLKEALAQPEQEPVICRFCRDERGCWAWQCDNCGEIDDSLEVPPPQRTWVGLTDEEKSALWVISRAGLPRYATYASLIEAKLKEKNT